MIPGYRVSRRLEGTFILTENDVRSNRIFKNAVAYDGWPMDNHVPGGLKNLHHYPSEGYNFKACYTILFGCYVSKNISNLMMTGRNISANNYVIRAKKNDQIVWVQKIQNNEQSLRIHSMENVECGCITLTVLSTYGCENARVFEVRVYEKDSVLQIR